MLTAPLLQHLDYSKPIFIRCDASRFGAGAVLFQYNDQGFEHPVCYASKKFLPAEQNWSTFSQEASTVVWALERFSEYTQGYHVIVECDHRNISFVQKSAMPQLARWRLRLQDVDFSIRYLSGPQQLVADGLSRQHVDDVAVDLHDAIPECALIDMSREQKKELAYISSLQCAQVAPLEAGAPASDAAAELAELDEAEPASSSDSESEPEYSDEESEMLFGPRGELLDERGIPLSVAEIQPERLRLPAADPKAEFDAAHNDLIGHNGAFVTLQRVLKTGRAWSSQKQMLSDIDMFLRGCPCCQKMNKRKSHSMDVRHVISGSPFSELSIDVLKLPNADAYGYQYAAVVVDNFSPWTSIVAMKNKSAFEAARALLHVVGTFGAPLRLRSDGGSEFVNGVITSLTALMGVTQHVILPYSPTANGIVERANRSILERLRQMIFCKRIVKHPEHVWSDLLPLAQRSINASYHSAIGTSPAAIMFGNNLDLDRCLLSPMPDSAQFDVSSYINALSFNQRVIMEVADAYQSDICQKVIARASKRQQRVRGGVAVVPPPKALSIGDWVLVKPQDSYPLHKLAHLRPDGWGRFKSMRATLIAKLLLFTIH